MSKAAAAHPLKAMRTEESENEDPYLVKHVRDGYQVRAVELPCVWSCHGHRQESSYKAVRPSFTALQQRNHPPPWPHDAPCRSEQGFKSILEQRLDQTFENSKFEDGCRMLMGNRAYMLFTLDKVRDTDREGEEAGC